jgi:Glyoxalase/Bleomycin resistance protein/Dioxygenase superfamily
MANDPFLSWANRTVPRTGREQPYLSIQDVVVFVRDLEVSKRFYVDQLGFELITEQCLPTGVRWIEVAPPDGSANLALVEPKPDRPEYKLIGGYRWVLFMRKMFRPPTRNGVNAGFGSYLRRRRRGGAGPIHGSRIRTGMRLAWKASMR